MNTATLFKGLVSSLVLVKPGYSWQGFYKKIKDLVFIGTDYLLCFHMRGFNKTNTHIDRKGQSGSDAWQPGQTAINKKI